MIYHGFYVKITPLKNILREQKDGNTVLCDGFNIEIFSDSSEGVLLDSFTAAVEFEILKNDISDAEEFARDGVEAEEKKYYRFLEEFFSNSSYGDTDVSLYYLFQNYENS